MSRSNSRPGPALTPVTFHIMLSLTQRPAHGYHVKRLVEDRTKGMVQLGAGTLYAAIRRMLSDGLIIETDPPADGGDLAPGARWRFYMITAQGRAVLEAEVARLEADVAMARTIIPGLA